MKELYKYGIGFWIGAGVLSLINMILNLKHAIQNGVLTYNYLMIGVSIFGLSLNLILLERKKEKYKQKVYKHLRLDNIRNSERLFS